MNMRKKWLFITILSMAIIVFTVLIIGGNKDGTIYRYIKKPQIERTTSLIPSQKPTQTPAGIEKRWKQLADMPTARDFPSTAVVDGKIYVIGGTGPNGQDLNVVEEYDPSTNKWTVRAPMSKLKGRVNGVAVVNGKIYVVGWSADFTDVNAVEEYDIKIDKWTVKTKLPSDRIVAAVVSLNGKIYVMGGQQNNSRLLNTVDEYDPVSDKWTIKAAMLRARGYFSAVTVKDKIFVVGGKGLSANESNIEEYNPKTNEWVTTTSSANLVPEIVSVSINNRIFCIGGHSNSTFMAYSLVTKEWETEINLSPPPLFSGIAAVNGKIFIMGGEKYRNAIFVYTPKH